MATKIQIRRDSAANWTSANPTLSSGEQGFETDTGKVKIGDGSTAWTSLAYFAGYNNGDVDTHLNTSTASTGEYLSWDGADYDWAAVPPGYDDADVDTHLNVSGASSSELLSWTGADYDWVAPYANADVDTHLNVSGASSSEILSWTGADYDWVAPYTNTDVDTHLNVSGATDDQILGWSGSDYGWVDRGYPTVTSDNFLEASVADKPFYMIYVGNIANRINLVTEGNALSWDNAFTTLEDAFAFVVGHSSPVSAYDANYGALGSNSYMIVLEDEGTIHAMGSASYLGLENIAQRVAIYSQSEFKITNPATNEIAELNGSFDIVNCQYVEISNSVKITGDLTISTSNVFIDSYTGNTLAATDFTVTGTILVTDGSYFEVTENDLICASISSYRNSMAYITNDITCTGDINVGSNSNFYIDGDIVSCDDIFISETSHVMCYFDVTTTDDIVMSENSSLFIDGVLTLGDQLRATQSCVVYINDDVTSSGGFAGIELRDNSSAHISGDFTMASTVDPTLLDGNCRLTCDGAMTSSGGFLVQRSSQAYITGAISFSVISVLSGSAIYTYDDITSTVGDILVEESSSMGTFFDIDVGTSTITSAGNLNIDENSNVWAEDGATVQTTLNVLNGSSFIADDLVTITLGDINVYDNSSFYVDNNVVVTAGNMEVQYNSTASIVGTLTTLEHTDIRFNSSIYVDDALSCETFDADFNSDITVWSDVTVTADLTVGGGTVRRNGRVYLSGSIVQSSATHTGAVVEITTGGELTHDSSSLSVAGSGTFTIDGATTLTTAQFTGKSFFGNGGSAVKDVNAAGKVAFLGMPTTDPNDGLSLWVDTAASNVVKLSVVV